MIHDECHTMSIPVGELPVGPRGGHCLFWSCKCLRRRRGCGLVATEDDVVKVSRSVISRCTGFPPRHVAGIHATYGTFFPLTLPPPSRCAATVRPPPGSP